MWLARTVLRLAPRAGVTVFGLALAVGLAVVVIKWAPGWLASTKDLTTNEAAQERGRVRTALLALLAGLLAALGAYYTHRTFGLGRRGQITERFTRAMEQLGNSAIDVRLGGIYALEQVARDSREDHPQVVEVLTAYLREHAPWPPDPSQAVSSELVRSEESVASAKTSTAEQGADEARSRYDPPERRTPPIDVHAVMTVLGRRGRSRDRPGTRLNLIRTDLRGAILDRRNEAVFPHADFCEANLQGVDLRGADLRDADLSDAILVDAWFGGANLYVAELRKANLQGADLTDADLRGARLHGADLRGADLTKANLKRAYLRGADLRGADLTNAKLRGAFISHGAKFQGATLYGAKLRGAVLFKGHMRGARYDVTTKWPNGFDPKADGARRYGEDE